MTSTAAGHYEKLLASHYTWMLGDDLEAVAAGDRKLFQDAGIRAGALAVDLGCGPGPQTLALADIGFAEVVGVDTSQQLLDELLAHTGSRPAVRVVHDDLVHALPGVADGADVDVVTCMRDTVVHLPGRRAVTQLFSRVAASLAVGGMFILSYRDLTQPLEGVDRFLPIRSDNDRIMLCVLDYPDSDTVTVTDLIYTHVDDGWELHRNSYPKLRLAPDWLCSQLTAAGLQIARHGPGAGGMWQTVATKPA
jgi:SAM-dependent methyltransferase